MKLGSKKPFDQSDFQGTYRILLGPSIHLNRVHQLTIFCTYAVVLQSG
jgi:hypothetical protein